MIKNVYFFVHETRKERKSEEMEKGKTRICIKWKRNRKSSKKIYYSIMFPYISSFYKITSHLFFSPLTSCSELCYFSGLKSDILGTQSLKCLRQKGLHQFSFVYTIIKSLYIYIYICHQFIQYFILY